MIHHDIQTSTLYNPLSNQLTTPTDLSAFRKTGVFSKKAQPGGFFWGIGFWVSLVTGFTMVAYPRRDGQAKYHDNMDHGSNTAPAVGSAMLL